MKKSTTIYLVSALLAGSVVAASPVFARGGDEYGHGRGPHHMSRGFGHGMDGGSRIERLAERLDLTPEQLASVRAIADDARPQMRELRDKMREGREQLRALVQEGTPSDEEVRQLADAQGAQMADMIVARTKVRSEIRNVLTGEQREQFDQMRSKRGRRN